MILVLVSHPSSTLKVGFPGPSECPVSPIVPISLVYIDCPCGLGDKVLRNLLEIAVYGAFLVDLYTIRALALRAK
jgi:hypothetical protein